MAGEGVVTLKSRDTLKAEKKGLQVKASVRRSLVLSKGNIFEAGSSNKDVKKKEGGKPEVGEGSFGGMTFAGEVLWQLFFTGQTKKKAGRGMWKDWPIDLEGNGTTR